ncbi:winged helix-turn-helix transcriptional regulator [Microbulbifer epialgicus]|uniref:Winged helix-turn-helix transcriptional regulator n=1 Tax=Microbulbifer epialgicus TaxID=393907 RepID=A0ABV4NYI9_9GAMM
MKNSFDCEFGCPIEITMAVIGGKWKVAILFHLLNGKLRFMELKKLLPGISQRVLTVQLRELEADKIISRKVFPEVPPRVEYNLTAFGKSLAPTLLEMGKWGEKYAGKVRKLKEKL